MRWEKWIGCSALACCVLLFALAERLTLGCSDKCSKDQFTRFKHNDGTCYDYKYYDCSDCTLPVGRCLGPEPPWGSCVNDPNTDQEKATVTGCTEDCKLGGGIDISSATGGTAGNFAATGKKRKWCQSGGQE